MNIDKKRPVKRLKDDERGVTVVAVVGIISLILALTSVGVMLVQSDRMGILHRTAQDEVITVAEGGVNDYIWRLNKDSQYPQTTIHPAQGKDAYGQDRWLAFGGGEYHLEITPPSDNVPMVTIASTGRVKGPSGAYVTRTVTAQVRKKQFTNYIYLTDYEVVEGTSTIIWWITGDVVRGPLHTNDDLHTNGTPHFLRKVTIAGVLDNHSGTPVFDEGYETGVAALDFPPTNLELKAFAEQAGYYYYGETTILLNGSSLNISNNDTSGKTTGPKGNVSKPANGVIYVDGLASAKYTANNGDVYMSGTYSGELTIAAKNIIYVTNNIRYNNPTDDMLGLVAENYVYVNHYNRTGGDVVLEGTSVVAIGSLMKINAILKAGAVCTSSADKTALGGTWTGTGPYTLSSDRTLTSERTLAGTLSLPAGSRLRTGSIMRAGTTCANVKDTINISGNWSGTGPFVLSSDRTIDGDIAPYNVEIDAAIAAVNHSFGFERYDEGTVKGTLTVVGSIAQKYRGPVGTFSGSTRYTGYSKDYAFDERMLYITPPHFIEPANAGYEIITWNESM